MKPQQEIQNQVNSGTEHRSGVAAESPRPALVSRPTVEVFLAHEYPMALDPQFDGACPCCFVDGDGFAVETHCWRTSRDGCKCQWSGVHVVGLDVETAQRVAEHMRDNNGWTDHTDWAIVLDGVAHNVPERETETDQGGVKE